MTQHVKDWLLTWAVVIIIALFVLFVTVATPKMFGQEIHEASVHAELPTQLHIRGELWTMNYLNRMTIETPDGGIVLMAGWTDCNANTIQIRLEGDKCDMANSVMHELIHASMCWMKKPDWEDQPIPTSEKDKKEFIHHTMSQLAGPLSVVLGQNPDLWPFFGDLTKDCK